MLRTQFDDIPDKDLNERIDRVVLNFHRELGLVVTETESLRLQQIMVQNFFSQSFSNLIFESATTGKTVDIVAQLPLPEKVKQTRNSTYSQFDKIREKLRYTMSDRPGFGVWGWLTGDLKKQQTTFLDHLAKKGNEWLEEARAIKSKAGAELQSQIDTRLDDYEALVQDYKSLTDRVVAGDIDGALQIIGHSFTQDSELAGLLLKPVGEHASLLLALTSHADKTEEESVIVSRFVHAVDNDSISLTALSHAASNAPEDKQETYRKYLSGFAGIFVPVGASIVNTNMYRSAEYKDGWLQLRDADGNAPSWKMDKAEANAVLEALAGRPNYLRIRDNVINANMHRSAEYKDGWLQLRDAKGNSPSWKMDEAEADAVFEALASRSNYQRIGASVVNTNMYMRAAYINGELELRDTRGNAPSWKMDETEANTVLEALLARPNYLRIGASVINTNMYLRSSYRNGELELRDTRGNAPSWKMDETEANAVLEALTAHPHYLRVGTSVINTNMYSRGSYRGGELELRDTRGNMPSWRMEEAEANAVFEALVARPNYQRVGASVINTNMYSRGSYKNGELELRDVRGNAPSWRMDEAAARNIFKEMRNAGQKMAIGQMASSSEQMRYTLRQSREWGSSYSSQDNSSDNNLMTVMLIVGAMTLFDSDPVAAAEMDFSGHGGDFGGGGANGDIPDADTPGIDTPNMDTGINTDFDTTDFGTADFNTGGGTDFGGGGGTDFGGGTTDFGGGGFDGGGGTFISCDPRLEHRLGAGMKFGPNFV